MRMRIELCKKKTYIDFRMFLVYNSIMISQVILTIAMQSTITMTIIKRDAP